MDAFYASVEQRDDPVAARQAARGRRPAEPARRGRGRQLRGARLRRPLGDVDGAGGAALPVADDRPSGFRALQGRLATRCSAIFREVTPLVEPLSLDEAYLDVTENAWDEPLATTVARRLKERIRADTGLTASAGVAPNKFLAKIASGWKKPDGLTVISPDRVEPFLQQLPVDALWGVGPVTARKLRARGIERLVDVRRVDAAGPARDGRQPRRLAAAAGPGHRRSAGRAESRDQVVGLGKHVSGGSDRPRRDSRGDRRDGRPRASAGSRARRCSPAR